MGKCTRACASYIDCSRARARTEHGRNDGPLARAHPFVAGLPPKKPPDLQFNGFATSGMSERELESALYVVVDDFGGRSVDGNIEWI